VHVVWVKSDYLFPADTGSKTRTYHLLRHLSKQLDITYLGFRPDEAVAANAPWPECAHRAVTVYRPDEIKAGASFYGRVALNLLSEKPYFVRRNCSDQIQASLREITAAQPADILLCDSLDMTCNIDFANPARKVLFLPSIETALWKQRYHAAASLAQRAYYNYETKRMAAFETKACNHFDLVIVTSEADRICLANEYRVTTRIEVVPTGVPCDFFSPIPAPATVPGRLMFSGSLDLLSNIDQLLWFASEILPLIKRRHPEVTLDIVGRNPAVEIIALGLTDSSIFVTGWVEDIRAYLAQTDLYIVPLRVPGGRRVKVYEAMAMRKPVVATTHGIEGLALQGGRHLLLADTPRDFADAVCALLDDPLQKAAIADAGWRLVNEQFDWSMISRRFVDLFGQLLASPPGRR
jgi:polysaccharide biosynthesis protein PslH